ncbi:MAG: hypothetical protein ACREQH_07700 [Candidatus Binatus sp.]
MLLFSVSTRTLLLFAALLFLTHQPVLAADLSPGPESGADAACTEIKTALHGLAEAEHDESLALDLASSGGNSSAIVAARLSTLLDRTQDLRVALKHARQNAAARDPMADQCTKMGFRALVISEKLTSGVEGVLFGDDDSLAQAPEVETNPAAPAASPHVRQP